MLRLRALSLRKAEARVSVFGDTSNILLINQGRIVAEGTVLGKAPARVICGNLQTANATIYIVDQVLTPPAA